MPSMKGFSTSDPAKMKAVMGLVIREPTDAEKNAPKEKD